MNGPSYRKYLVARGSGNRPLAMHIRTRRSAVKTLCGRNVSLTSWRIDYTHHYIDLLMCRTCRELDKQEIQLPPRRLRLAQ